MIDLHSHILFNVDDGSSSIEESLELLKKFKKAGFDGVIATPHYIEGASYSASNDEKLEKFNILKEQVKKNNIDINIYLGNEIFINDNIVSLIESGNIYPLNNSKYLLIEFPFHNKIIGLSDVLYEIKCEGYIPILAHPERYDFFQDDYDLIDDFKEDGILFQCNYGSILGQYGKSAEKLIKYLLKKEYVDFFGTDIHHIHKSEILDKFDKIEKNIIKYAGKDYYDNIKKNSYKILKEHD